MMASEWVRKAFAHLDKIASAPSVARSHERIDLIGRLDVDRSGDIPLGRRDLICQSCGHESDLHMHYRPGSDCAHVADPKRSYFTQCSCKAFKAAGR